VNDTSADGFVGTEVCEHLRGARKHVRGLVRRLTPGTAGAPITSPSAISLLPPTSR
jgi:uncharacterized protein YbjT (DUF2867 family)